MANFISVKETSRKLNVSQHTITGKYFQDTTADSNFKFNRKYTPELKPFLKWAGGKGQLVDQLVRFFPTEEERTFTKYIEPMVGGGALLFYVLSKFDFKQIYISDINAELMNAYNVIKTNIDVLVARLTEIQFLFLPMDENDRKHYYYSSRDRFNSLELNESNSVEKAALFIFLNKTCFNGLYRVNKKGQFNVPMGAYKKPCICDEENLRNVSNALQNVEIVCGDYTLSKSVIDKESFVYLDPPYRPISETSGFTSYNSDVFDDNEQIRLANFIDEINATGAKIVLSNSDPQNVNKEDSFFEDLYKSYTIRKVEASRMINSKSDGRGKIKELLICN